MFGYVELHNAKTVSEVRFKPRGLSLVKPIYQLLALLPDGVGTMIV